MTLIVILTLVSKVCVMAWTEPQEYPPAGNVPAPINAGSVSQTKTGGLQLSTPDLSAIDDATGNWFKLSGGYEYTYAEAKAICEGQGARLAYYSEIVDAFNNGANSCSWGWIDEGFVVYPVQDGAGAGCGGSIGGVRVAYPVLTNDSSGYCARDSLTVKGSLDASGIITTKGLLLSQGQNDDEMYLGLSSDLSNTDKINLNLTGSGNVIFNTTGNVGIGDTDPIEGKLVVRGGNIYLPDFLSTNNDFAATVGYVNSAIIGSDSYCQSGYEADIVSGSWYRIASNSGNRANAQFTLTDQIAGGGHSALTFRAGTSFSNDAGVSFTLLNHNIYSVPTFTKIRILQATTYDPQYLEVYIERTGTVNFQICDNLQTYGWVPLNWEAGSVPVGYTSRIYDIDKLFVVGDYDDRLTINRGGKIGINNPNPVSVLDVIGDISATQDVCTDLSGGVCLSDVLSGVVSGSGVQNYITKWGADSGDLVSSLFYDNGTNIGIGTVTPEAQLHLNRSSNTDYNLYIKNGGGVAQGMLISGGNFGNDASLLKVTNYDESNTLLHVTDSGVGIGGDPLSGYIMDVNGQVRMSNYYVFTRFYETDATAGDYWALAGEAGDFSLKKHDASIPGWIDSLYLKSDGNVGIGDTTPSYDLDVSGDINASSQLCIAGDCKSAWTDIGGTLDGSGSVNRITKWQDADTLADSVIYENASKIGIGTASPSSILDVVGNAEFGNGSFSNPWTLTDFVSIASNALSDKTGLLLNVFDGAQNSRVGLYVDAANKDLYLTNTWSASGDLNYRIARDRFYIKSDGKVGIGTTNPQNTLHVNGSARFDDQTQVRAGSIFNRFYETDAPDPNDFWVFQGTAGDFSVRRYDSSIPSWTTPLYLDANGNVGIGDENPSDFKLEVMGSIGPSGTGASYSLGSVTRPWDKLYVNTIDPVYEIDGEKYATYVSDFAGGVRTETSGIIVLGGSFKHVIDFDNLEKGSDLWLFWQTSNQDINNLIVILTCGFDGKAWYDKEKNKLIILTDKEGELSYRLTMPRKDDKEWNNLITE